MRYFLNILFLFSFFASSFGYIYAVNEEVKGCDPNKKVDIMTFFDECAQKGNTENSVAIDTTQGTEIQGLRVVIERISKNAIQIGLVLAIGCIVYAGIQYSLSGGDEEKAKKAKFIAIYSVIGVVLLLTAYSMINIIFNFIFSFSDTFVN